MRKQNLNLDLKGKEKRNRAGQVACEYKMFQAKGTAYIQAYT